MHAGYKSDRCLDAFLVALNGLCDGEQWYTSTMELQLASLEFCRACRDHSTLHLNITSSTPRSMLSKGTESSRADRRRVKSRVPKLRARGVTWNMMTAAKLDKPIDTINDAERLVFGDQFSGKVDGVAWPQRVKRVAFGYDFNEAIDEVAWPPTLQKLAFGYFFNKPLKKARWPPSLQRLELTGCFNQPLEGLEWPASVCHLSFGYFFDQELNYVAWPASLRQLDLGYRFSRSLRDIGKWLPHLEELTLLLNYKQYPHSLLDVQWPAGLKRLTIREGIELDGVDLPQGVKVHVAYAVKRT